MPSWIFIGYYRIFILPYISKQNRAYPHMDAPASSPPILFNSILARRTALRLKEFFFKNTYRLRALMLLTLILNRTTAGNEVTYRLNWYLFTAFDFSIPYIMQRYFLGASLQENFTHVLSSTTTAQLDSTTHHRTRDTRTVTRGDRGIGRPPPAGPIQKIQWVKKNSIIDCAPIS